MKKAILQFSYVAVVCLCIISCKDDPAPPSIVGTWTETSYVVSGCDDPTENESETCTSSCDVIVITDTTISSDGDTQTYTKTGTTITVVYGSISVTASYTVTETTLVLTQDDDFGGCKYVSTFKRS
jgi:hypothetical protein